MLKIGDFSRLARVTVKALRHYDEAGLLRPAWVEPSTGYRFYTAEQLETVTRILLLKDLGFSLADIRTLLGDPSALSGALVVRRRTLADGLRADRRRLRRLDAFRASRAAEPDPPPVVLRTIDPVLALTIREVVRPDDGRVTALFEAAEARVARGRARADASPFLLLHDGTRDDRLEVEICVPLKPGSSAIAGARLVEGARSAGAIVYRGAYDRTPSLFAALARWVQANGGSIGGPLREVYHRYGADQDGYALPARVLAQDPAEYVTELQAPIA